MVAIVLVDNNWAISVNGKQPVSLVLDQARFQAVTLGKSLIYGRKTYQQLPSCAGFKYRNNYMLSTTRSEEVERELYKHGVKVLHSIDEIIADPQLRDAIVVGGASVYAQLLPYCEQVMVTQVYMDFTKRYAEKTQTCQKFLDLSKLPDEWVPALQGPLYQDDIDAKTQTTYKTKTVTYFAKRRWC